jgi:hypothetical protein
MHILLGKRNGDATFLKLAVDGKTQITHNVFYTESIIGPKEQLKIE